MKQTNNAIKFLLAQYRSIFKHAYLKGLASTVVLTSVLAAGAANAGEAADLDNAHFTDNNGTYIIQGINCTESPTSGAGTYKYIKLDNVTNNTFNGKFQLDGGANNGTTYNYIIGSTIKGSGSLLVNTGAEVFVNQEKSSVDGAGLNILASGSNVDIDLSAITIDSGTLNISTDSSNTAKVIADTILIEGTPTGQTINADSSKDLGRAVVQLGNQDGNSAGDITLGGENTNLTVTGEQARLVINGSTSASGSILAAGTVTVDSGAAIFAKVTDSSGKASITAKSVTMNSGEFLVHKGSSGNFSINLTPTDDTAGTFDVKGGVVNVNSELNLNKGILKIGDAANLVVAHDDASAGKTASIVINANGSTAAKDQAVLQLSNEKLAGFLDGGVSGNFTDMEEEATESESGAIKLTSGGSINFTNATDIAAFKYAIGSGTVSVGKIMVSGSGLISGQDLTVSHKLTQEGTATGTAVALNSTDKLNIQAENLTLGSNEFDSSTSALGFSKAQTESITFLDKNSKFVLQDDVTLQNIKTDGNKVTANSDGNITNAVTVSGGKSFTIDGGIYKDSYNVTLASGSLNVINTAEADKSSLSLFGAFKLDNTNGDNTVLVSGAGSSLDLTGADVSVKGHASQKTQITVSGSGTLVANQNNLDGLFAAENSGSGIVLTSGTLSLEGNISLAETQLTSGSAYVNNAIAFDDSKSGEITVNGELTITGTKGSVDIGNAGTITAKSLSLQNINNKSTTLAKGTYTVDSGLSTTNTTDTVVLTGATLNLGQFTPIEDADGDILYHVGSSGGYVNTNLKLNDAGVLNVDAGKWNLQSLELTTDATGTVSIGGTTKLDANGNIITASVSGDKLTVSGSYATINANGDATFTEVYAKNSGSVLVSGAMTITGKHTASGESTSESFGVGLASGSVVVNQGGSLTLGSDLLSAITITNSGASINTNAGFEKGFNINGGKLVLGFDSDTSLTANAMKDLRAKLDFNDDLSGGTINVGKATLAGLTDAIDESNNTLDWNDIDPSFKDAIEDYEQEELSKVTLVGIDSNTGIKGNFGSVASDQINAGGSVNVQGNLSLSTAKDNKFATGKDGVVIGFDVAANKALTLNNGGEAGTVSLGQDAALNINNGETVLSGISGASGSDVALTNAKTTVNGSAKAAVFKTDAASDLTVTGNLETVSGDISIPAELSASTFAGKVTVGGKATFNADAELQADGNNFKDLTAETWLGVFGDTTATGTVTLNGDAEIAENATLTANKVVFTGSVLSVGTDGSADEENSSSSGHLDVTTLKATGGAVVFDPDYSLATTLGAIDTFEGTIANAQNSLGGVIQTNLVIGQNSAVMVGEDASKLSLQEFIKQFQDANGALNAEDIGAILMLNSQVTLAENQKIIVDSTRSGDEIVDDDGNVLGSYQTAIGSTTADLYLGKNSALIVNDTALDQDANGIAIYFNEKGASIKGAAGSKIILAGDAFLDQDTIKLFEDADSTNSGVQVEGTKGQDDIRVESLNGLMYFDLVAGEYTGEKTLQFDYAKADSAFLGASSPVRETLLSYASKTANYYAYANDAENQIPLVGDQANEKYVTVENGQAKLTADGKKLKLDIKDFVVVDGVAYKRAYNSFLAKVTRNSNSGIEADQAARMAAFGGSMQAALTAGASTYEAISGRMGIGAQIGSVTFADNGQGAGLWVTPVYKNHDSDGFEAQGLSYGADMDLYGVALGGDFTLGNGLRVGAAFNVGSGDADGQGAGSAVSNDFDYYGFAVYGGYTMDKFSVVADASYTVVDNDLEANTAVEKLKGSTDTSILSVGVTAQYAFAYNSVDVTPHAGLRYSYLDMDDYTVNGEDGVVGQYAGDSMSVFSIPVGVTFSKEIVANDWTVKPAFDLTLTANMGDDTTDGTMSWTGINNLKTNVETEVLDNWTYGATLGVSAKKGNFSMGFGVNYTGASSADEYGVSANARFVF